MIKETNALELFTHNLHRTNMLLQAIDKIRAYNRLHRMELTDQEYRMMVKQVQEKELDQIQQSCGEHAIISLATSFETYYKELLQQLLFQFPDHFTSRDTKYSASIAELINSDDLATYESIENKLVLRNRFNYYKLFESYSIELLSGENREIIEYIYLKRNNFVHNAGRIDTKTQKKLEEIPAPYNEYMISTNAKRLRTKLERIINRVHDQIISSLSSNNSNALVSAGEG